MSATRRTLAALLAGALVLGAAPHARAQAPDAGAETLRADGLPDAPAWWSAEGRAGYAPSMQFLGVAYPWTLAGLTLGSWSLDDARRMPGMTLGPGITAAHAPLVWYDSLTVARVGGDGAWRGFDAGMVPVSGDVFGTDRVTRGNPRTLSMFSFQRGSSALEDNALALARTDSLSAARFEVESGQRGAIGPYEDAGAHRYGLGLRLDRFGQRFDVRFAHRGAAMAITGGAASQSAMGVGGAFGWSLLRPHDTVRLELRRATDWHESEGWAVVASRRDQSEQRAELTWTHDAAATRWSARAATWTSQVRRTTLDVVDFDDRATGWWLAGRGERPGRTFSGDASLGMGSQRASGGLVVAPSLGLTAHRRGTRAALRLERVATPVWSDLERYGDGFLQDTWTGALSLAAGDTTRHVAITGRVGRTLHRALGARLPLEELWLTDGWREDPSPYHFALATFESAWRTRSWGATLEAFALARDASTAQTEVDPANGVRAGVEAGTRFFKRELAARVRLTAAVIGARQSEATGAWLAAYPTYGAAAVFTFSDVTMTVEAIGIEDKPHPLTWIDPRTGADAMGPGMETRVSFSWRLFD